MMPREIRHLRSMARRLRTGSGAAVEATSLSRFGADDCEPFWAASKACDDAAAKLERIADDEERANARR